MKILYLAHRIPYPPNKGDKIRSFNEIKYLSQRHEIDLACLADDPRDLKYEDDLRNYCGTTNVVPISPRLARVKSALFLFSKKPLSVPYFYSKKLQETIDRLQSMNHYDVILCYSSPMAEYVFRSVTERPSKIKRVPKLIMDFVDVDSEKWKQYANYVKWPLSWAYALESKRLSAYERRVAEAFDHSIFVTHGEEKIFKTKNPHIKNITVITNGVDLGYFSPRLPRGTDVSTRHSALNTQNLALGSQPQSSDLQPSSPIIVFTGAMDYYANIDGVIWFSKEIFPLIKRKIPEVQFYIVGSKPAKEILSLSKNNGIRVTGYVPDTREYFRKATLAVVPLRIAQGIQNKILEPMAMGIPVVGTSSAVKGTQATASDGIRVADNPEDFAQEVFCLIRDPQLRRECSVHARRYVENHHRWENHGFRLESLLQESTSRSEVYPKL
jgi:glycosyltransferase involved in cell wall biosynthesis